jgi:hypothetical protein
MRLSAGNAWIILRFLILSSFSILKPVIRGLSDPAFRPALIGITLLLLAVTAVMELFLLYLFSLIRVTLLYFFSIIRLTLILLLTILAGVQFLTWLSAEVELQETSGTLLEIEYEVDEYKRKTTFNDIGMVGSWPV